MRTARRAVCLAGAIGWLAIRPGGDARANGRFPASNAVFFAPSDDDVVFVRVTFGLLVSRDRARSWRWICERAIGFSGLEDPSYVVTKSGAIVAGLFDGLRVSRDGGCTWSAVRAGANVFVDLTMRADGAIVALASSYDRHADGGSLYRSQLYVSTDDARLFAPLGAPLDEALLASSVEVARGNPSRVYVSAVRGDDVGRRGVLLVSSDAGMHWTERPFALAPQELAPYIAAVDETRADRVFVRTSASPEGATRLVVTEDAGRTYRVLVRARGPLLGFALAPDGAALHVGGPDDGLFAGRLDAPVLARVSQARVQCLARKGDALWACSNEASGFVVGVAAHADDANVMISPRLHLRDIGGPLPCAKETSVAKECDVDWARLQGSLGISGVMPASDAGPPRSDDARATAIEDGGGKIGRRAAWAASAIVVTALLAMLLRRARGARGG